MTCTSHTHKQNTLTLKPSYRGRSIWLLAYDWASLLYTTITITHHKIARNKLYTISIKYTKESPCLMRHMCLCFRRVNIVRKCGFWKPEKKIATRSNGTAARLRLAHAGHQSVRSDTEKHTYTHTTFHMHAHKHIYYHLIRLFMFGFWLNATGIRKAMRGFGGFWKNQEHTPFRLPNFDKSTLWRKRERKNSSTCSGFMGEQEWELFECMLLCLRRANTYSMCQYIPMPSAICGCPVCCRFRTAIAYNRAAFAGSLRDDWFRNSVGVCIWSDIAKPK